MWDDGDIFTRSKHKIASLLFYFRRNCSSISVHVYLWNINSSRSTGQNPDICLLSHPPATCGHTVFFLYIEFAIDKEVSFKSETDLCIANNLSNSFQKYELWTYGTVSGILENQDGHVSTKMLFSVRRHRLFTGIS